MDITNDHWLYEPTTFSESNPYHLIFPRLLTKKHLIVYMHIVGSGCLPIRLIYFPGTTVFEDKLYSRAGCTVSTLESHRTYIRNSSWYNYNQGTFIDDHARCLQGSMTISGDPGFNDLVHDGMYDVHVNQQWWCFLSEYLAVHWVSERSNNQPWKDQTVTIVSRWVIAFHVFPAVPLRRLYPRPTGESLTCESIKTHWELLLD